MWTVLAVLGDYVDLEMWQDFAVTHMLENRVTTLKIQISLCRYPGKMIWYQQFYFGAPIFEGLKFPNYCGS